MEKDAESRSIHAAIIGDTAHASMPRFPKEGLQFDPNKGPSHAAYVGVGIKLYPNH